VKAILQNFKTGEMSLADVPPPAVQPGGALVRTVASLVSVGTERSIIELAKMNPLQKARARPDLVRKILARVGQDGLLGTAQTVLSRLSTPVPLGYSSAGIVEAVGAGVTDLKPGDRVACAGAGYANHAEVVAVPRNLLAPIPDGVSFQDAAFVTLGAIALHGVRQAELSLGESVVVIGLGLVGQLTVQLCAAHGCRVFGIDTDPAKVALATSLGMDAGIASGAGDVAGAVTSFTRGRGADAVLITASTPSSEPIADAATYARDRARVVAVGDVGLTVPRRAYYDKELELRLSRSYGPGRYDPAYEEKGRDYPIGYVRWTENRNMEAFLDLVAAGRVRVAPLVTRRYPIEEARAAYDAMLSGGELLVGVVLDYDPSKPQETLVRVVPAAPRMQGAGDIRIGVVGAGAFAQSTLLPLLTKIAGVRLAGVATRSGLTARTVADKFAAEQATSDALALIASSDVDAVLIATRHDTHADLIAQALAHGKHVFVEKPLAVDADGLQRVIDARAAAGAEAAPLVLTGFNRRFSPLAERLRGAVAGKTLVMTYRVNAGAIPGTSWVQDAETGGGRIVGEVCHFIDTMQFLTSAEVIGVFASAAGTERLPADPDNLVVQLTFADGSVGSIVYASGGSADLGKERLEVFGGGIAGVIDNWRKLTVRGPGVRIDDTRWLASAKGHAEEMAAFVAAVRSGGAPIAFASQVNTTRATFAIQDSLREGRPIAVES
jgi:predicted dehydrogenase/threonine dehydrogenase-like Zn-dependent dehydrogenase